MKKIIALVLVAVAFALPSQAQFKFGVQGGLNLTSMSLNKSEFESAVSNNAGFFIGPTVKFTVPIVGLSLDAAALYDQRSADAAGDNGTSTTIKQQTLQIPINVRYGIGLGSVANIFAFVGPQFGFNLGSKDKPLSETASEVKNWTMNSSNVSLNLGLGATLLSHLQLKVNYNVALGKTGEVKKSNIVNNTASAAETLFSGKSNAWQISAAYYF